MRDKENRRELRGKLIRAGNMEEVRAILGPNAKKAEIDRAWREIEAHRPAEGLETVDDDELAAVSGGADRDWIEDGCAATVEKGSWCGSDDFCIWFDVTYSNYDPCPKGGNHEWKEKRKSVLNLAQYYRQCKKCGEIKKLNDRSID